MASFAVSVVVVVVVVVSSAVVAAVVAAVVVVAAGALFDHAESAIKAAIVMISVFSCRYGSVSLKIVSYRNIFLFQVRLYFADSQLPEMEQGSRESRT